MRFAASFCLFLLVATAVQATEPLLPGFDRSHAGRVAPDVAFTDPAGTTHRLSEFKGRKVLVVFWASWCPTCRGELPGLAALQAEMAGKGPLVVTISQDTGGAAIAERFLKSRGWSALPAYGDPERRLGEAFGQAWLPTAILIDGDGREEMRAAGGMDWASAAVRERLSR